MLPGLTPEEARDLIMSVGTYHGTRRLSPVEVAVLFDKAVQAGATPDACAQFARFKGASMLLHFQRLLRIDPPLRHLIGWKQSEAPVSFIVASELGRLNADEQGEAFALAIENQMRRLEVIQMIQLRRRSRLRLAECAADVLRMRTNITRKHVYLGAVTDDSTRKWLAGLRQVQRDQVFADILKSLYGALPRTSGSLGVERFTIVADEIGAARIKSSDGSGFEMSINGALLSKVPAV